MARVVVLDHSAEREAPSCPGACTAEGAMARLARRRDSAAEEKAEEVTHCLESLGRSFLRVEMSTGNLNPNCVGRKGPSPDRVRQLVGRPEEFSAQTISTGISRTRPPARSRRSCSGSAVAPAR